jgi:hypothetical protein
LIHHGGEGGIVDCGRKGESFFDKDGFEIGENARHVGLLMDRRLMGNGLLITLKAMVH